MNIFNIITLVGGLAMFLYGMRMMGDGLKESSSGTLKRALEKLTNTPIKAFLLGLGLTAVIQSSTATIVITSGLVGAGIIPLRQSMGIVIGANVGTTVTGQIIRLLDIDSSGTSLLQFFKPSTLAPLALIAGIILIMACKFKGSDKIGQILVGFGILFSGLLNMTDAVGSLTETGIIESLFSRIGENPIIGYVIGAGVAFALQSSSASVGILQAFSTSGQLTFGAIYAVLVGIYLGDCVTTAIVCNIGAKPDAKRVGIANIVFNLGKSILIFVVVLVAHQLGLLDGIWNEAIYSGGIANANTIFNLTCAILLFPMLGVFEQVSCRLVKDEPVPEKPEEEVLEALSPVFFGTPALAFGHCYDALLEMFRLARGNVERAFALVKQYDEGQFSQLSVDEERIDTIADRVGNYLVELSSHISDADDVERMNHYHTMLTELERVGDHANNIGQIAGEMQENEIVFSPEAMNELDILHELLDIILDHSDTAFRKRDLESARHIEPLEEVMDDLVNVMKDDHLERLRKGTCSILAGTEFLNLLSDAERISDLCSNIGVATIVRAQPELKHQAHDYISMLHAGRNTEFNREYQEAHDRYFARLG